MIKQKLYSISCTEFERIIIRATAGAEISNCIREAGLTSLAMGTDVELIHNGKNYQVKLKDLIATIKQMDNKALNLTSSEAE